MSLRSRLLLIAGVLLVAGVCAGLGIWQVNRLQERRSANAAALAARAALPVVLSAGSPATSAIAGRRVQAAGHYAHGYDIVIRGRQYRGVPGVEIVSPLLLEGDSMAVLVNRGFVPSPDAFSADPDTLRETGAVRVEGIALPIDSGGGFPLRHGERTTWARLDLKPLAAALPYPIHPVYIRLAPDTTRRRFPRPLDPPLLDDGPHLSYAIQWFAFSILAVVFGIVILKQKRSSRGPEDRTIL
jgi:surfeit locus 1 family protein